MTTKEEKRIEKFVAEIREELMPHSYGRKKKQ